MFRTSYDHHQEDYVVYTALYGMFFMHFCSHSTNVAGCAQAQPPTC